LRSQVPDTVGQKESARRICGGTTQQLLQLEPGTAGPTQYDNSFFQSVQSADSLSSSVKLTSLRASHAGDQPAQVPQRWVRLARSPKPAPLASRRHRFSLHGNGTHHSVARLDTGLSIRVSTVQFRPSAPPQNPRPSRACGLSTASGANPKIPQNGPVVSRAVPARISAKPSATNSSQDRAEFSIVHSAVSQNLIRL